MKRLLNYFFKGLILLVPLAVTVYVTQAVVRAFDGWLGLPIPGTGFVATIVLVTLFGFVASSFLTKSVVGMIERFLNRLPFVRLLYNSTKDLLNAFVGEKRRFDKPVLVTISPDGAAKALGFVTQEGLKGLGIDGHVAVYFPQSYNFTGLVLLFPKEQVRPVAASSADVMAFIISGGVTAIPTRADTPHHRV